MSDTLWSEAQDRALLLAWSAEILDALGGGVPDDDVTAAIVASVVLRRALLLDLDAFVRVAELREAPAGVRRRMASCLVGMAHRLRVLGLSRADVRRLDLGRRR
jgi:hypothetical protein